MRCPTVDQIIVAMRYKGHAVFDSPAGFDLNIVGIRTAERRANRFDDLFIVFYRRLDSWVFFVAPCTTDPGTFWLNRPMTKLGTAILKEGQYRGAYQIGDHLGKYKALVQRKEITVIRDANGDNLLDLDSGVEESGFFGINIHHATYEGEATLVDKWSAGCQVLASWHDFQILMDMCKGGFYRFGNNFTYTLLTENDFKLLE